MGACEVREAAEFGITQKVPDWLSGFKVRDALRLLEATVFAFLVGNSDMHLENWTLVCDGGRVALSPAYDLLPVRVLVRDPEELALPINGRKNWLRRRDFAALASHLKIPEVVTRRTLDHLPVRLLRTLGELPSPRRTPGRPALVSLVRERWASALAISKVAL